MSKVLRSKKLRKTKLLTPDDKIIRAQIQRHDKYRFRLSKTQDQNRKNNLLQNDKD